MIKKLTISEMIINEIVIAKIMKWSVKWSMNDQNSDQELRWIILYEVLGSMLWGIINEWSWKPQK